MKTKVTVKYYLSGEPIYYVYKWIEKKSLFGDRSDWQFNDCSSDETKAKAFAERLANGTLEETIAEYGE